jgi:murein DD-endopeptidase MepM/ murein hydrolase activator NlpD
MIILNFKFSFADYNYIEDKKKQILYYKFDVQELDKKVINLNIIISNLQKELKSYEDEVLKISELLNNIDNNQKKPGETEFTDESQYSEYVTKLTNLKENFKQRILWLYKSGLNFGFEVLFTSSTFNEFSIRLEYLQKISQIRKKDFEKIKYYEYIVDEKKKVINLTNRDKLKYISGKKENQKTLEDKILLLRVQLSDLRNENENLLRQINNKRNFIDKIENLISIQPNEFTFVVNQEVNYNSSEFSGLENKLIYPVNSNYILIDFGKYFNASTWTFEYNNGIDFSIARNSDIKCVANGVVERIEYIPGYGQVIVIKHSNEFRTIYSIVKDINVILNQNVNAGDKIAKTSENIIGQSFHFEIWNNKTPVDPKKWIKD